jgi:hypothetical protein
MFAQFAPQVSPDAIFKKTFRCLPDKMKEELYNDSFFNGLTSEFYFFKDKKFIHFGNMPPMEVSDEKICTSMMLRCPSDS